MTCNLCNTLLDRQRANRLARKRQQRMWYQARNTAIKSGKVIMLYDRDEITGIHYGVNRRNYTKLGGVT